MARPSIAIVAMRVIGFKTDDLVKKKKENPTHASVMNSTINQPQILLVVADAVALNVSSVLV